MRVFVLGALLFGCADKTDSEDNGPGTGDAGSDGDGGSDGGDGSDDEEEPIAIEGDEACDPLAEGACMLPWPSDRYLKRKASNRTGYQLAYEQDAAWANVYGFEVEMRPFNRNDGFSPSSQLLTVFDEPADLSDAAFWDSIERSEADDHPTVLLDLTTGDRLPHWVENDARATDPDETVLFVRPLTRLEPNRRYAVAIRGLNGLSGDPLTASPAFAALRDGVETSHTKLESRRASYNTVFDALEEAGVERSSLQQAWWFKTASEPSMHEAFTAMRADSMEWLDDAGIGCTYNEVTESIMGGRLIDATVTVPWYMDDDAAPAKLVRDAKGLPVYQGTEEVRFKAYVPQSLIDNPESGTFVLWGHGLFGSGPPMMDNEGLQDIAEVEGLVMAATDWHGMSSKDLVFLAGALNDASNFYMLGENLQQGMIIKNALTRSILGVCGDDEPFLRADGGRAANPNDAKFIGVSQGSVLGGTFLAQSPDIERGALIVGGATFSFMIERSIHFITYDAILMPAYDSRLVTAQLMAMSQHVWDNAESSAFLQYARDGFDDAGPKRFLYLVAQDDAQVPNLASDVAVRITGMPVLADSSYYPYGAEIIDGPTTDSAFISFDMGDRDTPRGNQSPQVDDGGHDSAAVTEQGIEMIMHFLDSGEIASTCGGPCVFGSSE